MRVDVDFFFSAVAGFFQCQTEQAITIRGIVEIGNSFVKSFCRIISKLIEKSAKR